MKALTPAQLTGFWARVDKSGGPRACWTWRGVINRPREARGGYGQLHLNNRTLYAHRVSWFIESGEMPPPEVEVMHAPGCLRSCVRPDHLSLGDHALNQRDGRRFGRLGKHLEVLDERAVLAIRRASGRGWSMTGLAAIFKVHRSTVGVAVRGGSWAHLPLVPQTPAVPRSALAERIRGDLDGALRRAYRSAGPRAIRRVVLSDPITNGGSL